MKGMKMKNLVKCLMIAAIMTFSTNCFADANDVNDVIIQNGNVTCASPTDSNHAATKEYVDDQITAHPQVGFGSWTTQATLASPGGTETIVNDHVYVALTDGFVVALGGGSDVSLWGYSDGSNPPLNTKGKATGNNMMCFPVRKGDYWMVTGAATIYWLPLGN